MANFQEFLPARRRGVILHAGIILLTTAASGGFLMLAMGQETRGFFISYLVGCVAAFLPIPLFIYRLFSLLRAKYVIDRDGLHIQWGLRTEDIPMFEIEWMRLANEMPYKIPLPRFSLQGAIIGIQQSDELGTLEFIASDSSQLVLIACQQKVLVLSPKDISGFQLALRRFTELGSIAPIQARSTNVELLLTSILKDKTARSFILGGIILSVGLLLAVSFIIPRRSTIALGFNPSAGLIEQAPSERLLLLPIMALFVLVADVSLGAYLFRKEGFQTASYISFSSSLILPLSFLLLVLIFIL